MEYYFLRKFDREYNLSEQQLVDCLRSPVCNGGCKGCWARTAIQYLGKYGVDFEGYYPYIAKDQKCKYFKPTPGKGIAADVVPQWYTFPTSEKALAYTIFKYGWVSVALNADALHLYGSGVIRKAQCGTLVKHAVIAVGYGINQNGIPFWILRNS